MRKAFTLIELLVVVGIMGLMITVGLVGVRSGQAAARTRGAARDVFAVIRHARSTALVTMQPAVLTYSCEMKDGEPVARIVVDSAKILDSESDAGEVRTLSGEPLPRDEENDGSSVSESADMSGQDEKEGVGETMEDILFAPISEDVVKGMRLKVVMGDDDPAYGGDPVKKSKVSVFSNVDYLIGKFKSAKKAEKAREEADDSGDPADKTQSDSDLQEEVSVVWETNGRTDPHQVWIYPDGSTPESGLLIRIDRFGGVKVVSGDGREDDE